MSAKNLGGCEYLLKEVTLEQLFTPEEFSDEQKQMAATTEQFVATEVLPRIDDIEAQKFDFTVELMSKCAEIGIFMIDGPEAYGGLELDKVTSMLVAEKLGAAGSFAVTSMAHTGIGTLPLVYYGTHEQKERYLEKLLTGELIGAYCLTEPGSGSDALGAATTAILSDDGKHYILNGTKQFITNAGFADLFTVFAKVDKRHFTGFLVERGFTGVAIGPEEKKLGIKGSSTCQVILDDVKVPVGNLLGEIGKGHKIAFNVLNVGRFKLGAGAIGSAKLAFQTGACYANERKQFGKAISSFGAVREKLADLVSDIFAAEASVYRLAGLLDDRLLSIDKSIDNYYTEYQAGIEEYAAECAITKVLCSEMVSYVVDEVLQIHGGYGFVSEYSAERFYRDARISRIYEGTNEINRMLIPGVFLAKGMKGDLPLQEAISAAFSSLKSVETPATNDSLDVAKDLIKRLKSLFLIVGGAAVEKYAKKLSEEQEILMQLADIAIQIFAMESAVLRAAKNISAASETKQKLFRAVALVSAQHAAQKALCAAQKAAYYIAEGDQLKILRAAVSRLADFDATGLLDAKRLLADAISENEKYVF